MKSGGVKLCRKNEAPPKVQEDLGIYDVKDEMNVGLRRKLVCKVTSKRLDITPFSLSLVYIRRINRRRSSDGVVDCSSTRSFLVGGNGVSEIPGGRGSHGEESGECKGIHFRKTMSLRLKC